MDAAIKAVTTRQQKADAMPKKRVLSPEARARIAEAQRKRWAASKKAAKKAAKNASPVKAKKAAPKKAVKRTLSPEARQRIADAQRKRWAAAKKLESAAHPKATKKAPKKVAPRKAAKVLQQWRCRKARSRRLRLSVRVQTRPLARSFYDRPMHVLQLIHPRRNPVPLRTQSIIV